MMGDKEPKGVNVEDLDDDLLDGCSVDLTQDPDDDLTASLRPLFPDGDPSSAPDWQALASLSPDEEPHAPQD